MYILYFSQRGREGVQGAAPSKVGGRIQRCFSRSDYLSFRPPCESFYAFKAIGVLQGEISVKSDVLCTLCIKCYGRCFLRIGQGEKKDAIFAKFFLPYLPPFVPGSPKATGFLFDTQSPICYSMDTFVLLIIGTHVSNSDFPARTVSFNTLIPSAMQQTSSSYAWHKATDNLNI